MNFLNDSHIPQTIQYHLLKIQLTKKVFLIIVFKSKPICQIKNISKEFNNLFLDVCLTKHLRTCF